MQIEGQQQRATIKIDDRTHYIDELEPETQELVVLWSQANEQAGAAHRALRVAQEAAQSFEAQIKSALNESPPVSAIN